MRTLRQLIVTDLGRRELRLKRAFWQSCVLMPRNAPLSESCVKTRLGQEAGHSLVIGALLFVGMRFLCELDDEMPQY
jgi:hypothetical protein